MTASEFAFLALGLILGTAAGAALLEVLRSRPPTPHEVRVTVAPATVPTRPATLAGDPFARSDPGPAPFGPGDRRLTDRPTDLPSARHALPDVEVGPPLIRPALVPVFATAGMPSSSLPVGAATRTPVLDRLAAVPEARSPLGEGGEERAGRTATVVATVATGVAVTAPPADEPEVTIVASAGPRSSERPAGGTVAGTGEATQSGGPCAELRAVADDRCAVAARARDGAEAAAAALRESQRDYDEEVRQAEAADALADPRQVRAAKEAAQHAFRTAHGSSGSREELEAAARTWLATINRINLDARDATVRAGKARAAANALVTTIERLTAEADAARIAKEAAEEACVAARQAVAECEETEATAAAAAAIASPAAAIEPAAHFPDDEPELALVGAGEREARIIRLLNGDRDALMRTVAELGGDDPAERRRWQIALTGLVDALTAQAIDASILDVPERPPFWEPFTAAQRRDIVGALASLGYRYDGLGGFADGRVPSQRDLSLALGYAGLDPMRVRRWPTEVEARELLTEARVAADEYLAGAAGGMSLSEMVGLLGRRADALTDLWNDWGRVRPRLLAAD